MKYTFFAIALLFLQTAFAQTSTPASADMEKDEAAIREVLNNYINSIYDADSTLVAKVTDENLQKSGHYYARKSKKWSYSNMTFEELKHTAATYNSKKWIPENAPHEVTIFEVKEQTASAKIEAIWGFDYVLLSKNVAGNWIMDKVLWQSYSPAERAKRKQQREN